MEKTPAKSPIGDVVKIPPFYWDELKEKNLEDICKNALARLHLFQGPHELKVAPLLKLYGNDLDGFIKAAEKLGGKPFDQADAAYTLYPLPKIPLYYILWKVDEEFGPHLSILFDRSIEYHLAADAIWGLVNYVSGALLRAHK